MSLIAYLKLVRISALPTLWSNTLTAFWIGFFGMVSTPVPRFVDVWAVLVIFGTSTCLYLAGMVLNDVFDAKNDAIERPERPIPSGRVSAGFAAFFGWTLLFAGLLGVEICFNQTSNPFVRQTGFLLAICIVGYDALLKHLPVIGPIAMGACRFFNILFVFAVTGYAWQWSVLIPFRFGEWDAGLAYPWLVGIYVAALTTLSRFEGFSPKIQRMVGFGLSLLIPLDALICLHLFGPMQAALILCLYPLAMLLRRIVPMS